MWILTKFHVVLPLTMKCYVDSTHIPHSKSYLPHEILLAVWNPCGFHTAVLVGDRCPNLGSNITLTPKRFCLI